MAMFCVSVCVCLYFFRSGGGLADMGIKTLFSLTNSRYTASCGERRIRVHTAAAPVVADLGEMYRKADTGAIVSVLGRLGTVKCHFFVFKLIYHGIQDLF